MTTLTYDDLRHVTYSHSDYVDILQIHADYISHKKNKTLIIDTDSIPQNIKDVYDQIIYYDDSLPYASRILHCLNSIEEDFVLLMHDNDILLRSDGDKMEQILHLCMKHNMDRLDLQNTCFRNKTNDIIVNNECQLVGQVAFRNHPVMGDNYVYNVNPSIWNKQSLSMVMEQFNHLGYREIEGPEVQQFCGGLKIYKISTSNFSSCGHFDCADFFTFFHITHGGELVPFDGTHKNKYGRPYENVASQYQQIIKKYKLFNSKRWSS